MLGECHQQSERKTLKLHTNSTQFTVTMDNTRTNMEARCTQAHWQKKIKNEWQ